MARRVVISGQVQGVFFRDSCGQEADRRHVSGWVRNCDDGTVEAVFEGEADAVQALVDWCRTGPAAAEVRGVEVHEQDAAGEGGFRVR